MFRVQVIIDNILAFLNSFTNISFVCCFRECNVIAHRVVKWPTAYNCESI